MVLVAGGYEKEEQCHEDRDRAIVEEFGIVEPAAPARDGEGAEVDGGTEGPEEGGGGEDGGDGFFLAGHGAEGGVLLLDVVAIDLDIRVGSIDEAGEDEPGEQEHAGCDGDAEEAPGGESQWGSVGEGAFEDDLKDEVGRGADERGDATN